MKPKRILYVTPVFPPTKVPEADHALHECVRLAERGHEIHVLTTPVDGLASPEGIHVHADMEGWGWSQLPTLLRTIRRVAPHATMLYFLGTLFDYSTMILFLPWFARGLRPGSRMITKLSNIGEGGPGGTFRTKLKRRAFRWLGPFRLGALLTSSHHLVLLSEVYRERLKAFWLARLPLARAVVIPPAPLLPIAKDPAHARCRGRSRLDVRDDEFVVSFFGRMYPGKGIEQLLGAAAELVPAHPRLRFALIGGVLSADHFWLTHHGYADTLLDLIEELGLVDRVVATGEYAWDSFEASEYLYASDVAVLPLSMGVHAYNSSFAAACAHGLPVIATRGRFVEGAFEHRQNIYFLDEASERCIADAIEEVMADDDLRGRLAAGSRDLAARLFDWDRSVDRLEELLEKGRK